MPAPKPPTDTAAPAPPPPEATGALSAAQAEEVAALRIQVDQLLDAVLDQQNTIATLKTAAAQGGGAQVVQQSDVEAELDAELAALLADPDLKDYPAIQVFEHRVLHGIDANLDIRLKGEPPLTVDPRGERRQWHMRWFNLAKEGRAQQAAAEGYLKVLWDDLQDPESVATGIRTDQYVRKGERGTEYLYKIPLKMYVFKKKADAMRRQGMLQSTAQMRDHVANSVAAIAGNHGDNADQAGSFAHRGMSFTVEQGPTERVTVGANGTIGVNQ